MSSIAIVDAVLCNLAASYNQAPSAIVTESPAPKARKVRAKKEDGSQAAPSNPSEKKMGPVREPRPSPSVANFREANPAFLVAEAKEFLIRYRSAKDLDGQKDAIASFIGYEEHGNFGIQERDAKSLASRALRPVVALTKEYHSCQPSVEGVINAISSVDRELARTIANLQGREKLTVDAMLAQEKLANEATNPETKHFHQTLAAVERERLVTYQRDLKAALAQL
jgi:hypothetical protein